VRVTIYCGVPGSGKTTMAKRCHPYAALLAADDLFTKPDGSWEFDPSKLGEAHAACLRRFIGLASTRSAGEVVVHNTNSSIAELAPYAAVALAYGCELDIVTLVCDPAVAAARNVHGVPPERVLAMHEALAKREVPPWWPHRYVDMTGRAP
jgi:predicted kinase